MNNNLIRDEKTKAIINTDNRAYKSYIARKNKEKRIEQRLDALTNEVNELKNIINRLINE